MALRRRMVAPIRFLWLAVTVSGRERESLIQAGKMALAAVIAWLIAKQVHAPQSFIAPYAAVFMMSATVYRSLAEALRQVTSLVLGVLIAFVMITAVPNTVVALGIAVFVGMAIGRWHRLGDSGIWVGVTALLMLTYGTAGDTGYLGFRVLEGVIGVAVGLVVNLVVLPPVWLGDLGRAVQRVGGDLEALLRSISAGLRDGWDRGAARAWRRRARGLESALREAEDAAGWGRESIRLNPRWTLARGRWQTSSPLAYEQAIRALDEATKQVQHITETLVSSADPNSVAPSTGASADAALADVLDELAAVIHVYGDPVDRRSLELSALRERLDEVRDGQVVLADRNEAGPHHESVHTALLLSTERAIQFLIDDHTAGDETGR